MPIVVINPNSTVAVTADIEHGLADFGPSRVTCLTLSDGPPGIETAAQIEAVEAPLLALARRRLPTASAFVIACFSDPGFFALAHALPKPVFGMARSGLLAARSLTDRIGVISMSTASVQRHQRLYRSLRIDEAIVDDRSVGLSVVELATDPAARERLVAVAGDVVERGARALVLACAGMTRHRGAIQRAVGVPVIDPIRVAVGQAVGVVG